MNKIKITLIGIGILVILVSGCVEEKQKEEFCDTESLEDCNNKNITLEGKLSAEIFQHPLPPYFQQYENIDYLDTEQGQIVLLSKEKINCKNNIKIYGLLEKVAIDCEPGATGKCPYRGYRVYVHEWGCLESENITKEQAIAIANATEEVREFLKLYPDAKVSVEKVEDGYCTVTSKVAGDDVRIDCNTAYGKESGWVIAYQVGDDWKNSNSTAVRIGIDDKTGEILAKYPKLEYIKNSMYCGSDADCNLVEPICSNPECTPDNSTCEQGCGCVPSSINFIHQTRWEEKEDLVPCANTDIVCKPCAHRNCYEPGCMDKRCAAKWKEGAVDRGFGCG